ncbi:NAD/NADP octopine/nopaline dehydrogenase family protein, partial [Paraburkholderia mimosarum]
VIDFKFGTCSCGVFFVIPQLCQVQATFTTPAEQLRNFSEFAFQTKVHNATKITPAHMQDRYLSEDIPYILVPWYALGEKVGVDAPTIKATVEIASVINGINYFEQGRNSNRLGVDRMTKAELLLFASRTTTKVNL